MVSVSHLLELIGATKHSSRLLVRLALPAGHGIGDLSSDMVKAVVICMQVDPVAGQAFAAVWSVETCREVARLHVPEGSRGVHALAFSGGAASLLTAVVGDNRNTVYVFDWASGRLVSSGPGYAGVPPQVFGAVWDVHAGGGQFRCVLCTLLKVYLLVFLSTNEKRPVPNIAEACYQALQSTIQMYQSSSDVCLHVHTT